MSPSALQLVLLIDLFGQLSNKCSSVHALLAGAKRPKRKDCFLTQVFLQVPLFIMTGQKILVDTRTDTYLNRVKG